VRTLRQKATKSRRSSNIKPVRTRI
jgi:hypothetical protein